MNRKLPIKLMTKLDIKSIGRVAKVCFTDDSDESIVYHDNCYRIDHVNSARVKDVSTF